MNSQLEALFSEPEKAYLRPDELNTLSRFVSSLPERINFYRRLRDEELALMQAVATALEQQFPEASEARLKRSLQNGILVLRCAAMAMLTDDPSFVTQRLGTWLPEMVVAYDTAAIDKVLYQLIKQQLTEQFASQQTALMLPGINTAQALLAAPDGGVENTSSASETLAGLF
ncbi:MAG: hypothetical protein AAFQ89_04415 [Cyanobacteria bacterium J06626_18]